MRYRLPEGCSGVSLAGVMLDRVTDDGLFEADASAAADLAPHGIVPVGETTSTEPARKERVKR